MPKNSNTDQKPQCVQTDVSSCVFTGWTKEELRGMLYDVVDVLDLSEEMIFKYGQEGTAPSELVRLVLAQKDSEIRMLEINMKRISAT